MSSRTQLVLSLALLAGMTSDALAQIQQVPVFAGMRSEGFETQCAGRFSPCVNSTACTPPAPGDRVFNMTADLCTPGAAGAHITSGWSFMCSIGPHTGGKLFGSAQGWVEYAFDNDIGRFGGYFGTNSGSSDIAIRFYDAGRVLLAQDMVTVVPFCTWVWNGWEVLGATGVRYIQVENSAYGGAFVDMDDMQVDDFTQPPTCMLTGPTSVVTGDAVIAIDPASPSMAPSIDIDWSFSTDGGATFTPCTASAASPLANPSVGVPLAPAAFAWDTAADSVGVLALEPGVIVMATVNDGISLASGNCQTLPFDVDNSALCQGICGDCNLNGLGPDILDALEAAQIAAGLTTPTMAQIGCCDVNSSTFIEVLDALLIAQSAAGLPVSIQCL